MFNKQMVSVVMPAYNEESGILSTVKGYIEHPIVDEVVVVDNNSDDKTAQKAAMAGARVVVEKRQGYGFACRKALENAKGEFIVLTEADNSFYADDLSLLFSYIPYFDMVKGARSNCNLISSDADWTFPLMFGNWAVAKYMQILYFGKDSIENMQMREMGGTFRVMTRQALNTVWPYLNEGQSAFLAELTSVALRKKLKILEIPVRYKRRLGTSKITGNRWQAAMLALRMIKIITINRFRRL